MAVHRAAPLAQSDDGGNRSSAVFAYGGVSRRWRNAMMMADDVDAQSDDDGGRCGCAIRWVADDVVRQPPKDGWVIVAPGWLAYLGLVFERKK